MDWNHVVNLIDKLAWPLVIVVVFLALRTKLSALIDRTREFEGPADMKIKLDPTQVERIVDEGKKQDTPASVVAHRIITQAVVDGRELRILRALIGEDEGRSMYSYQSPHYRPALEALIGKGLIQRRGGKYLLTDIGLQVVAEHLEPILARRGDTKGHV